MKLSTTWNEHGKIWYYFTTPQEAQAARLEGVVFNAALGVWRSIAGYACKSCGTETERARLGQTKQSFFETITPTHLTPLRNAHTLLTNTPLKIRRAIQD